jgi:hypothetical protein
VVVVGYYKVSWETLTKPFQPLMMTNQTRRFHWVLLMIEAGL